MTIKQLDPAQWKDYFNDVARSLESAEVEIEIVGPGVGDQVEAEWLALNGLSYDERNNSFDVATKRLNHSIAGVSAINIDQDLAGLKSVEVIDANGNHQILRFKQPLALPEPEMS